MKDAAAIEARIAKLIVRRDLQHDIRTQDQFAFQITELQWVLGQMQDSGGGVLLPSSDKAMSAPMEIFQDEVAVEEMVRAIIDPVYHAIADAGSPELQNLLLARVQHKLSESLLIEQQSQYVRRRFLAPLSNGVVAHPGDNE
jgi:hypothetical protein